MTKDRVLGWIGRDTILIAAGGAVALSSEAHVVVAGLRPDPPPTTNTL